MRKYRAHHVAECTVEGDLDDPWYPRQPYDEEEAEEAGRGGWRRKGGAERVGKTNGRETSRRAGERRKKESQAGKLDPSASAREGSCENERE